MPIQQITYKLPTPPRLRCEGLNVDLVCEDVTWFSHLFQSRPLRFPDLLPTAADADKLLPLLPEDTSQVSSFDTIRLFWYGQCTGQNGTLANWHATRTTVVRGSSQLDRAYFLQVKFMLIDSSDDLLALA